MIITTALLFFLVALIYSSAGFGGGSSYLAILSQFPYSNVFIRFTGLSCNTIVTTAGTFNFYRKGWIVWKPLLLLLSSSIPFCIWSASWKLETNSYFITLGCCLLVAGLAMLFQYQSASDDVTKAIRNPWWLYLKSLVALFGKCRYRTIIRIYGYWWRCLFITTPPLDKMGNCKAHSSSLFCFHSYKFNCRTTCTMDKQYYSLAY